MPPPEDVQTVCYFFSLALFVSFALGSWAVASGEIPKLAAGLGDIGDMPISLWYDELDVE